MRRIYHHARGRETRNFANLAPWLDVLFGTYHRPSPIDAYELGLDEPMPQRYLAQLVLPFILEKRSPVWRRR